MRKILFFVFCIPKLLFAQQTNKQMPNYDPGYFGFSEGLCVVWVDNKTGYIDRQGNIVIAPIYDSGGSFKEGLASVKKGVRTFSFITKEGKEIMPFQNGLCSSFSEGWVALRGYNENGETEWKFIDKEGNRLPSKTYDALGDFKEGLALAQSKDAWGYINVTGKEVIACEFNQGVKSVGNDYNFSEGLAKFKSNNKYGFINKVGKIVVMPTYEQAGLFKEGLASVNTGDSNGFINKLGEIVIPPIYETVSAFSEGMAVAKLKGKYGMIDKTGKIAIPFTYENLRAFSNGLASFKTGNKFGFINKLGKIIVPAKYDEVRDFSEGLAWVKLLGKFGLIDKIGRYIAY